MRYSKVIRAALPNGPAIVATFFLPFIFGVYFFATRSSQQFIAQQNISYWDVQNNYWGRLFVNQTWLDWFDKVMNYALWGLAGAVVYIIVWSFSANRAALHNHLAEEEFVNFNVPRSSWHGHFVIELLLKIALLVVFVVCLANILVKGIPLMSQAVSNVIGVTNQHNLEQLGIAVLTLVFFQLGCITAIKTFRIISFE